MNHWLESVQNLAQGGQGGVLVTVAETRGSTPRETGAKLLVGPDEVAGTIGGGNLEFKAVELARRLLAHGAGDATLRRFPLGPALGQCCGGVATVLFEPLMGVAPHWSEALVRLRETRQTGVLVSRGDGPAAKRLVDASGGHGSLGDPAWDKQADAAARELLADEATQARLVQLDGLPPLLLEPQRPRNFHIVLFGAGHVGRALARLLGGLDCTVDWVDSRPEQFPRDLPGNVRMWVREVPEAMVDTIPSGSYVLVMTHSHPLDQRIVERVLRRADSNYCGLIGSESKRRNFERRLLAQGLSANDWGRLSCPIGVPGIVGKRPEEIAVAVAAELLQVRDRMVNREAGVPQP